MRFYQVRLFAESGQSFGYEYFLSANEAIQRRYAWIREHGNKTAIKENGNESAQAEVRSIDIDCSKQGVLRALNQYASHPNNG